MKLKVLRTPSNLITDVDQSIIDLAHLLDIDASGIDINEDHLFISGLGDGKISIESYLRRTDKDVWVSIEVFSNVLMDIAAGIEPKTAFQKLGYSF